MPFPAVPDSHHPRILNPILASTGNEPAANSSPASTAFQQAIAPEPGSTGSNDFNEPRKKEFCSAVTRLGGPCQAYAHGDVPFCIAHDPTYREVQRQNCAAGGRRSGEMRATREAPLIPVDVSTPAARLDFLGYLIAAQLQGRLSRTQSTMIARALEMAMNERGHFRLDPALLGLLRPSMERPR